MLIYKFWLLKTTPDAFTCGTDDMEDPAMEATDAPLLFAVKYLIRENRNCISSLQFMLDENRDLFVPLSNCQRPPCCSGYSSASFVISTA